MGYFETGLTLGLFVYAVIIGLLTFKDSFKEWFYGELFEDTVFGSSGQYLFFPSENMIDKTNALNTFVNVASFLSIHLLLFAIFMVVFTIIGGLLSPLIFLGVVIGPFIYYLVKKKRAKREEQNEDEQSS